MLDFSCVAEAARCRANASTFLGKPEALVLLRLAQEFDALAARDEREPDFSMRVARVSAPAA